MSQWVQQNPTDMQRPRKTPHSRQQKQSTSSSCKVKWVWEALCDLNTNFLFLHCFLSTKLRKFFSQSLQLGRQKETKFSLVHQCLETKSYPQKNLNRRRQEIWGYKSFLNAGMSLSSSLHGVAHPSMQKKIIYSGYKLLGRGYMKR